MSFVVEFKITVKSEQRPLHRLSKLNVKTYHAIVPTILYENHSNFKPFEFVVREAALERCKAIPILCVCLTFPIIGSLGDYTAQNIHESNSFITQRPGVSIANDKIK